MEPKLYVGNLSYQTTEDEIRDLFAQAGTVSAVDLIKDRDTGSSKGFAFVTMGSQSEAENAINTLNGRSLGRKAVERGGHLEWKVAYEPGTLAAVGWRSGRQIATAKVEKSDRSHVVL